MTARLAAGRLRVLGTGQSLPGPAISNQHLLTRISQNFGISTRRGKAIASLIGIDYRHHARDWLQRLEAPRKGERNPDLSTLALRKAFADAALTKTSCAETNLQYLIGHTTTPASLLPPSIAEVAMQLSHTGPYMELRQACTGFANALQIAFGLLNHADAKPVGIVGSELGSVFLDPASLPNAPDQWVNLMQMGDGAGAIILAPDDDAEAASTKSATIESAFFGHLATNQSGFSLAVGGSDFPSIAAGSQTAHFQHDFESVRTGGAALFAAGFAAAKQAGVKMSDLAYILPHQANGHIGDWLAREYDLPPAMFYGNARQVGNLGSAAIWVALDTLRHSGLLNASNKVLVLGAEASQYMYGGFVYTHA